MSDAALSYDIKELYQDLIMDHGKRPRNFRHPEGYNHEGVGHNPVCGDRLMLYLTLNQAGVIEDAAFQGMGCAISTASASMMTEMLKGRTKADAEKLFNYFHALCTGATVPAHDLQEGDEARLQALAGVRHFPMRVKCATLAWHTLHSALNTATGKIAEAKTE